MQTLVTDVQQHVHGVVAAASTVDHGRPNAHRERQVPGRRERGCRHRFVLGVVAKNFPELRQHDERSVGHGRTACTGNLEIAVLSCNFQCYIVYVSAVISNGMGEHLRDAPETSGKEVTTELCQAKRLPPSHVGLAFK